MLATVRRWDVAPDGRRFLMIQDRPTETAGLSDSLVVVLNWIEELKAKVPIPAR